jgi:hypothetical protein
MTPTTTTTAAMEQPMMMFLSWFLLSSLIAVGEGRDDLLDRGHVPLKYVREDVKL